jgi:glycosyltransferase involved in cell wall biosynthesis
MVDVSVIIPAYNRALFLIKAIDSVLKQTYKSFEIIVVDDGSVDNTKFAIQDYKNRVKYIYQENKGPASARNRGIKESKANFIAFLDSDDSWAKDKLKIQIEAMYDNPQYLISHTQEVWYRNGKLLNQMNKHKKFGGFIFEKCLPICAVGMSTVMARRELFDKIGLFDENLPCCEDYDLWLRASVKLPFLFIDKPFTAKDGGRKDQVSRIYACGMDRFRIQSIKNLLEKNNLVGQQRESAFSELERKCRIYANGCLKHNKDKEAERYFNIIREFQLPTHQSRQAA